MKRYFFDSHGFMQPFCINQNDTETEREFSRRCWYMYLEMCKKYDGYNGSGNTVYMSDKPRKDFY